MELYRVDDLIYQEKAHINSLRIFLDDEYLSDEPPTTIHSHLYIKQLKFQTLERLYNVREKFCKYLTVSDDLIYHISVLFSNERYGFNKTTGKKRYNFANRFSQKTLDLLRNDMYFMVKRCIICDKKIYATEDIIHCKTCHNIQSIGDSSRVRRREYYISHAVYNKYPSLKFRFDKFAKHTNRRPDIQIKLDDRILCIEIDEYQHKCYKDEEKRLQEIIQHADKRMIFIRLNIDSFYINDIYYPSPWKYIKCEQQYDIVDKEDMNKRLNMLFEHIDNAINMSLPENHLLYKICYSSFNQE